MKASNIKKVLIALDLDPTAQKVAETGFAFAKTMGAEITLLHVLVDATYYYSIENFPIIGYTGSIIAPLIPQIDTRPEVESKKYLDRIKKHLGDDTIQTLVAEGDFANEILKVAKEMNADVIVLGSHSKRWMDEILMGSVTEKVLHHSSIPLFIIPTKNFKK
jgi:nucleotide-binding universal stress UspA family protein